VKSDKRENSKGAGVEPGVLVLSMFVIIAATTIAMTTLLTSQSKDMSTVDEVYDLMRKTTRTGEALQLLLKHDVGGKTVGD